MSDDDNTDALLLSEIMIIMQGLLKLFGLIKVNFSEESKTLIEKGKIQYQTEIEFDYEIIVNKKK